jgi:glycosyltransferase involved in cell wall biosynthesis
LAQTHRDIEILFLDDASSDRSVDTAQTILSKINFPYRIVVNEYNSGSVYAQWQHGLDLAAGDYIWFAEADDACHRFMLSRLVSILDNNSEVGLAYCQSAYLSAGGKILDRKFYKHLYAFIDERKWCTAYINNGLDEICTVLAVMNTIPNSSSVLMRRKILNEIGGIVQKYKVSGDWATYIEVLTHSNIAFLPEVLNYNRIHPDRVTVSGYQSGVAFYEALDIFSYLQSRFTIPEETRQKFVSHFLEQKFLTSYGRVPGEDVISSLLEIFPSSFVYDAITEYMQKLARFQRETEAMLLFRIRRLTVEKVIRRILPQLRK